MNTTQGINHYIYDQRKVNIYHLHNGLYLCLKPQTSFFIFYMKENKLSGFPTYGVLKKIAYPSGSKNITEPFEGLKKSTADAL